MKWSRYPAPLHVISVAGDPTARRPAPALFVDRALYVKLFGAAAGKH
jgi:hypothetical protein